MAMEPYDEVDEVVGVDETDDPKADEKRRALLASLRKRRRSQTNLNRPIVVASLEDLERAGVRMEIVSIRDYADSGWYSR